MRLEVRVFACPQCGAVKFRTVSGPRPTNPPPNCDDCTVPNAFGHALPLLERGPEFVRMEVIGQGGLDVHEIDTRRRV